MGRRDEKTHTQSTRKIRDWNDRLRKTGVGGKLMLTRAVAQLDTAVLQRLLCAMQAFDAFTPDNDPWHEHDFGQIDIDGLRYFWKIDAYDLNLEYGSSDPADETVTRRVLTIMTAEDL